MIRYVAVRSYMRERSYAAVRSDYRSGYNRTVYNRSVSDNRTIDSRILSDDAVTSYNRVSDKRGTRKNNRIARNPDRAVNPCARRIYNLNSVPHMILKNSSVHNRLNLRQLDAVIYAPCVVYVANNCADTVTILLKDPDCISQIIFAL